MEILKLRGLVEVLAGTKKKDGEPEKRTRPFRMLANTGQPFDRWFGKAVVDLSGIAPISDRGLAMLLDHDSNMPAGIGREIELTNEGLVITGDILLKQDAGQKVSELSDDGFPLTASIGIRVHSRETLDDDAEAVVNGETFKGPIEIWRQGELTETSFIVANPADLATTAEALQGQEQAQEGNMKTLKEILAAVPEEHHGLAARLFVDEKDLPEILAAVSVKTIEALTAERDTAFADSVKLREQLAAAPKAADPSSAEEAAAAAANAKAVKEQEVVLAKLKAAIGMGHKGVTLPLSDDVDTSNLSLKEQCKLAWDKDPALRGEFLGVFRAYELETIRAQAATA